MSETYLERAGLKVAASLANFIEDEAIPGTGIETGAFWHGVADIYARFAPANAALLRKRDELQARIDGWHRGRPGEPIDPDAYQAFLREIGYLTEEPAPFAIAPENVDPEIAQCAGPQLVVPILDRKSTRLNSSH